MMGSASLKLPICIFGGFIPLKLPISMFGGLSPAVTAVAQRGDTGRRVFDSKSLRGVRSPNILIGGETGDRLSNDF